MTTTSSITPPSVRHVVRWSIATTVLALLLAPFAWGAATGGRVLVVDGGSMEPSYSVGDLIALTAPTAANLDVGAVITVRRDDGVLYTHRIIDQTENTLVTQGDANPIPDTHEAALADVVGVVTSHIGSPWAAPLRAAQTPLVRLILAAIFIAALLLPIGPAGSTAKARRSRQRRHVRPPRHA